MLRLLKISHAQELVRDSSHAKVSRLQAEVGEQKQQCMGWYFEHMQQKERSQITKKELCGLCWNFRFTALPKSCLQVDLQKSLPQDWNAWQARDIWS